MINLILCLCLATAAPDSTGPPPPPLLVVSSWAAHYGMDLVPSVEHWSSTLPTTGAPVKFMEWQVTWRDSLPEFPVYLVEQLGLKSTVHFWNNDRQYEIKVRGIAGSGTIGPWSTPTEWGN